MSPQAVLCVDITSLACKQTLVMNVMHEYALVVAKGSTRLWTFTRCGACKVM